MTVITLIKNKGPAKLLGKITFPGGKIEDGEDLAVAATRELMEESVVHVPEADWKLIRVDGDEHYELSVMAAFSDNVHLASTQESEIISILGINEILADRKDNKHRYVDDFYSTMGEVMLSLVASKQPKP